MQINKYENIIIILTYLKFEFFEKIQIVLTYITVNHLW